MRVFLRLSVCVRPVCAGRFRCCVCVREVENALQREQRQKPGGNRRRPTRGARLRPENAERRRRGLGANKGRFLSDGYRQRNRFWRQFSYIPQGVGGMPRCARRMPRPHRAASSFHIPRDGTARQTRLQRRRPVPARLRDAPTTRANSALCFLKGRDRRTPLARLCLCRRAR